ncbi:Hypothetical protein BSM4216_3773 [Bacillus smithii]|nr:Hypothetical protein BSM4216_3773 [Bacillus smithii]
MAQYHIPVKDRLLHGLSTKDGGICWNKSLINPLGANKRTAWCPPL